MKYYIEYPIPIICNLKCVYCFHQILWRHNEKFPETTFGERCPFTPHDYMRWRDKHLADGTEFLCELHGGEMSHPKSQNIVLDIIDTLDKERFQLQTNGLGDTGFYDELIKRKEKIDRIGFTYHRKSIGNSTEETDKFHANVMRVKDAGLYVYVKELLHLEEKEKILVNKAAWEDRGIEFRIQDFKGYAGATNEGTSKYTDEDWDLLYPEYCHTGIECSCRKGYKQVLIRGYDNLRGDVLACWQNHVPVGNIVEDWYTPGYWVEHDETAIRGKRVKGIVAPREDEFAADLQMSLIEDEIYKTTKSRKGLKMKAWAVNRMNELEVEHKQLLALIEQRKADIEQMTTRIFEMRGAYTELQNAVKAEDQHEKYLDTAGDIYPKIPAAAENIESGDSTEKIAQEEQ